MSALVVAALIACVGTVAQAVFYVLSQRAYNESLAILEEAAAIRRQAVRCLKAAEALCSDRPVA